MTERERREGSTADKKTGSWRTITRGAFVYLGIIGATLVLVDVMLIVTGLLPPPHDYGDPALGWTAAPATGEMRELGCYEYSRGERHDFTRNEDGYRTSVSATLLEAEDERIEIGVTGDSHTDLCSPNTTIHFGVTERVLTEGGEPAVAFSYGAGRYSPLQAYLAIAGGLIRYDAEILILNLYTGNDFYDILRVDDRPHFVADGDGYAVAPPSWYQYDPPDRVRRSRVLFAMRSIADGLGIRGALLRLRYLRVTAAEQGESIGSVLAYVNDLRKASAPEVGYPEAYTAQILNQQLFFHRFPQGRAESVRRIRALLELVRIQHPERRLLLSPIPSYQVVGRQPVDPPLLAVLERLPITYEGGVTEEEELYYGLRELAEQAGWDFVDNLTALRSYTGIDRLYNDFDYHIEPVASEIIGRGQATVIRGLLNTQPAGD